MHSHVRVAPILVERGAATCSASAFSSSPAPVNALQICEIPYMHAQLLTETACMFVLYILSTVS